MIRPIYLYIFGNLGGPFKVGYSFDPKKRSKGIWKYNPGHYFCDRNAIMWLTVPLPDVETAKTAERAAHKKMAVYVMPARDIGVGHPIIEGKKTEWFDVTLGMATKVVHTVTNKFAIKL